MPISRLRLLFATEIFLGEMRRQFAALHPDQANQIKPLSEYPERQRSALMKAVELALASADSEKDKVFADWVERTNTQNDQ